MRVRKKRTIALYKIENNYKRSNRKRKMRSHHKSTRSTNYPLPLLLMKETSHKKSETPVPPAIAHVPSSSEKNSGKAWAVAILLVLPKTPAFRWFQRFHQIRVMSESKPFHWTIGMRFRELNHQFSMRSSVVGRMAISILALLKQVNYTR